MKRLIPSLGALTLLTSWGASDALACGGTFCDQPPPGQPAMPVDQSGETILFVMHEETVEAHIQIQYTGDAERFAWVIPVSKTPEFSVGSQQLFVNMLNATVPTFQIQQTQDFCGFADSGSNGGGFGCGMSAEDTVAVSAANDSGAGGTAGFQNEDNIVKLRQTVGAYEVAVLESANVDRVLKWLEDNGFLGDDDAPPILADYVDKGSSFAVIKMRAGAGLDETHPLIMRYEGGEPCVPLTLTGIAAEDDMDIRVFFLSDERVMPSNYQSVEINEARLDWSNPSTSYKQLVTAAVDAAGSDGLGFVTEYAGASSLVSIQNILDPRWEDLSFANLEAQEAVERLRVEGLLSCSAVGCESPHPLVLPLLRNHLPAPDGVSESNYYNCVDCFEPLPEWEGQNFQDDFYERIVLPAQHALYVLGENPYLTRIYTTMSAEDMTEDPIFHKVPGLPNVAAQHTVTVNTRCDGEQIAQFANGREVGIGTTWSPFNGTAWPTLDESLAAETITDYSDASNADLRVDNADSIDQLAATTVPVNETPITEADDDGGCGCRAASTGSPHGAIFSGLALAWWLRRNRTRRHQRAQS